MRATNGWSRTESSTKSERYKISFRRLKFIIPTVWTNESIGTIKDKKIKLMKTLLATKKRKSRAKAQFLSSKKKLFLLLLLSNQRFQNTWILIILKFKSMKIKIVHQFNHQTKILLIRTEWVTKKSLLKKYPKEQTQYYLPITSRQTCLSLNLHYHVFHHHQIFPWKPYGLRLIKELPKSQKWFWCVQIVEELVLKLTRQTSSAQLHHFRN